MDLCIYYILVYLLVYTSIIYLFIYYSCIFKQLTIYTLLTIKEIEAMDLKGWWYMNKVWEKKEKRRYDVIFLFAFIYLFTYLNIRFIYFTLNPLMHFPLSLFFQLLFFMLPIQICLSRWKVGRSFIWLLYESLSSSFSGVIVSLSTPCADG